MANLYTKIDTMDVILRMTDLVERDPRDIADRVAEHVLSTLAEEFLKKYRNGILGALNADDIAYKLNDAVAELVRRKLLEDTNEPA